MNGKSNIHTYTLPCVKQIAGRKLLYNTGSRTWCSMITYSDGMRGGEGGSKGRRCMYNYELCSIHGIAKSRTQLSDWTELNDQVVVCVCVLVVQSLPTLCNPMDCSPPGSFVHGDSLGKNTGVGCHALLQGIFPTQGSNHGLLHCRWILYGLSYQGGM